MTAFSGIMVLCLWLPSKSNVPVLIFSGLYGFGSGAFISLSPALVAQISDIRELGVRNGVNTAIIAVAALTGNPIGGALVPDVEHGTFWKLQVFCGVMLLAGSFMFVVARVRVGGFGVKKV